MASMNKFQAAMPDVSSNPGESKAFLQQTGGTDITQSAISNAAMYNPLLALLGDGRGPVAQMNVTKNGPEGRSPVGAGVSILQAATGQLVPRKLARNPLRTDSVVESPGLQVPS